MLTKKEYTLLYKIQYGRTNLERLEDFAPKKDLLRILKKLEKQGLIKIEVRDNEVYGFMETTQGLELLQSKEYKKWYEECGD